MHGRRTPPTAAATTGSALPARAEPDRGGRAENQLTVTVGLPEWLIEEVARRLADRLATRVSETPASPWLSLPAAAAYLGFSRDRLYKLTAARAIPCHKKRDGQGLLFHREELDAWLEQEYPPTGSSG